MNWIRPAAIGAGAAIAGIGLATQTMEAADSFTAKLGERYWDRQHSGEDRSATDYYGASAIFASIGAIGLAVGGATLLVNPNLSRSLLGGAALVGAGVLGGAAAGGFRGFAAGESASSEKHGARIEDQADRLLRNLDRDDDGALSTADDAFPEYLHKYEVDFRRGSEPVTKWTSIERFVQAADADDDQRATREELVDIMRSYDANANGVLSSSEIRTLGDDGLERVAVQEQIIEFDHWGAAYPVEW